MLRNLVKLANELDRRALVKEADYVDHILLKVAQAGTQRSWGQEYYVDERGAGGNVAALQTALKENDPSVKVDGIFGPNTKAALEAAGGTMGATAAATLEALKAAKAAALSGERIDSSVGATGLEEAKTPVDAYVDTTQSGYHQQARDDARAGRQDARQDVQQARINSRHEGQDAARKQHRQNQDEWGGAPSQRRQQVRENQDTRRDQRRDNQTNRRQQREDRQTARQQARAERRGYQSNPGGEGGPQQAVEEEAP